MKNKYFKPKSLTWLASAFPVVAGVVIAVSKGVPAIAPAADILASLTGGADPAILINAGLAGIGLRAAVDK